ncbi:aldehyde:ferredoxin oxidoreductase [Dethiosulfatibacter aminovorans DSM 17477]|uniref:Aldehyde:ferredoxin oxidoreductase n=1 Tax=Dethiosulfatibacter aminovorans DSM 17477 TaxID=1121476 RepID=A0A1M6IRT6_9FIRM|nr:aldehyde ferredoxin oxidoreductase family protein [Dethiosulfatibacter aminovorans]SHJ37152.1 aldehyde:ferredoxin oxidoreductase [Dethiosulfatibacter aminovorans DSM 17477]
MKYGYAGKILRVNLEKGTFVSEKITEDIMRKYLGGKGLLSLYFEREIGPEVEPLSKDNILYFFTGIMSGIPAAGTSRIIMGCKSPVTGGFGMAESGGFIATEMKKAGWDGIIIEGKSKRPVYLYINDDKVEIRDAAGFWGRSIGEVNEAIKKELGDERVRLAQIGPAGENLVQYSCVINDLKHACGRSGIGAVMGSKNLKAVAVKGTGEIRFKDKEKILETSRWYSSYFKENPLTMGFYMYGTAGGTLRTSDGGMLPTRNFREGSFEKAEDISGQNMADTILIKREGCFACPVRCKRVVKVDREDMKVDPKFGGPEYETIGAMGSMCGIGSLEVISKSHELCNDLGLDTISAGVTIAFAMECYERGIIDDEITQGIELNFGNSEALLKLIEDIAHVRGFGKILSKGTRRASKIFGEGSEEFAMQVKGQELPMHEPRGKVGVGLAYALSPTGSDHMQAAHDTMIKEEGPVLDQVKLLGWDKPLDPMEYGRDKAAYYAQAEKWWSFLNMAGVCDFIPAPRGSMPIDRLIELLNAATGWEFTVEEALEAGEMGIRIARRINYDHGVDESHEKLPKRLYQPLEGGALKGRRLDREKFDDMKKEYYDYMGFGKDGRPE